VRAVGLNVGGGDGHREHIVDRAEVRA
jgi:hypothetical protein